MSAPSEAPAIGRRLCLSIASPKPFAMKRAGSDGRWRPAAMPLAATLALLTAATGFRLLWSLDEPFWLDEAYSAYAAGKGFHFLWHVVPAYETHPPFYYSLLRVWTLLFGDTVAGHRSLGFVCGLATLPLIWIAARDLARTLALDERRIAWTALLFAAFSIVLVAMTREVRPYPVMILVYAGAIWALVRLGAAAARDGRIARAPFAAYLAGVALMLWLHNLGPLFALALGLALLALVLRRTLRRGDWALLVGGHAAVGLLWLPALLILMDQAPTWVKSTWLQFSTDTLETKLGLLYAAPGLVGITAAIVLLILAFWRLRDLPLGPRCALALAALAFAPVLASIIISAAIAPVFIVRTMTPVAVPAMLLMAVGAAGQVARMRQWAGVIAGVLLVCQMVGVDVRERQAGPQQDWYNVVRFLAARWRPGDIVLAYPNEGALPLDYALRDKGVAIPVRPVPVAVPAIGVGGWNPTGSRGVVSLSRPRLRAIAEETAIRRAPTVWLLRLGPLAYDKGDIFLRELARGRVGVARLSDNPIDLIGLRRRDGGPVSGPRAGPAAAAARR